MTTSVIEALDNIKSLEMFDDEELYFIGGTALSYYLEHRISEDIDIVSTKPLPYKKIISVVSSIGGRKLRDENVVALRMAGLFPDEYMLKFDLHGVKLEFFRASTSLQQNILKNAESTQYLESSISILDVKSIAKLKLIALLSRYKSRDLFDFKVILEQTILSKEDIIDVSVKVKQELNTIKSLYTFIEQLEQPKDDEVVYLDENHPINLTFEDIKRDTLLILNNPFFKE
jgi:hypothetical protein